MLWSGQRSILLTLRWRPLRLHSDGVYRFVVCFLSSVPWCRPRFARRPQAGQGNPSLSGRVTASGLGNHHGRPSHISYIIFPSAIRDSRMVDPGRLASARRRIDLGNPGLPGEWNSPSEKKKKVIGRVGIISFNNLAYLASHKTSVIRTLPRG